MSDRDAFTFIEQDDNKINATAETEEHKNRLKRAGDDGETSGVLPDWCYLPPDIPVRRLIRKR